MDYLKIDDLIKGKIVYYGGEKLKLINSEGAGITVVNEANDNNKKGIDRKALVFIRQRWRVEVLPENNFSKVFTTHRKIEAFYCTYEELLKEQQRVFSAKDIHYGEPTDTNELGDDFNGIF